MNAVEIEQAVSELAEAPFDAEEFPYAFLEAFGNKSTTLKKLRSGTTNKSDLGGLLQRNNIHIMVCSSGGVGNALTELKNSPATAKGKVKIILAAKSRDSLEDIVVKMTGERLRRKKDLDDEVDLVRQRRGKKGSVFTVNAGLPSLGKKC